MRIVDMFTCRGVVYHQFIDEKDMTIPGQNQSIPDMIARHTAGVPLPAKEPLWFGDKMPINASGQSYDSFDVMLDRQKLEVDYEKLSREFDETVKQLEENKRKELSEQRNIEFEQSANEQ